MEIASLSNCLKPDLQKIFDEESIVVFYDNIEDLLGEDIVGKGPVASDCLEVGVVTEGCGVHYIGEKPIPCKVGDIYIIPSGVEHRYFLTSPTDTLVVRKLLISVKDWLRGDAAVPGSKRYCYGVFEDGASVAYAMLNARMKERIGAIIDYISDEISDREDDRKTVIRSYIVQLFSFVARYINRSVKNSCRQSKDAEIAAAVIKTVEENFSDNNLSLETISAELFVSVSKISRIFKAHSGQLFSEYLREVRMNHSAKLLEQTKLTVDKIVAKCGIKDVATFYRNFREEFGMSPQIYRQLKELNKRTDITEKEKSKMEMLNEISVNVQNGRAKAVKELVEKAIAAGVAVEDILNDGLLAGMSVIGEKFKNNEVYVPEVLVAARAMSMGTQILKPYLIVNGLKSTGKVCIGTVQGDLHDIGKNLVKMMMEGKGLEVIDLGTDVPPDTFIKTAIEQDCKIICCSALLTTTIPVMADVVKAAEEAGIRDKVKIMIGGAPVNEEFCKQIGADIYTVDAASAADAAVEFCKK
ncbi:MAG: cobalamin-dependent protein [Clostridia bacterium]|nr:cobalamin-dependent protein [Clostridia bacterium]